MINLDHVHFQLKTVIYFVQTFGNIYTIVPFCKHALRVFHVIAWLILLAHAQTDFPPVYSDITFPCQINVTSLKEFSLFNYAILTSWLIYAGGGGGGGGGGGLCIVWTEGQ